MFTNQRELVSEQTNLGKKVNKPEKSVNKQEKNIYMRFSERKKN